ncbi:MAG: HEAT repeat domain-containing protein [Cyanobium sp.]
MPPSLTAALVAALLTATWLLGRRRAPLLSSTDTSDVAALNRAQIALVQSGGASQPEQPWPSGPGPRPGQSAGRPQSPARATTSGSQDPLGLGLGPMAAGSLASLGRVDGPAAVAAGGRSAYRNRLEALFRRDRASRLLAIEAAHRWGDRLCLPLLRRGLRDSDPAVMRAAALAIERFRGRTAAAPVAPSPQPTGRPRRVARTR